MSRSLVQVPGPVFFWHNINDNISKMETQSALLVLFHIALFTCSLADGIAIVKTGEVLVLDCFVEGPNGDQLDHEVVWLLDGTQVSTASRLVLPDLDHTYHGSNITCYNGTALVQSRIIHFHHEDVLEVGETLRLNCTTYPTAATDVTWHHSNKMATSDWVITDLDNVTSQLKIPNVALDDSGVYSCMSPQGATIKVFNISIGLFPQAPNVDCSGCNTVEYTCEWPNISDTHLPTDVTYEYKQYRGSWTECPVYDGNACYFKYGDTSTFRLNITNALGTLSVDVPEYSPLEHFTAPAPNITSVDPVSSHTMDIRWTLSGCNLYMIRSFKYKLTYRNRSSSASEKPMEVLLASRQHNLWLENANTEYCFRVTARKLLSDWGKWSKEECRRTLPTAPNVGFQGTDYTNIQSKEREDERDIMLTWKLIKTDSKPFQGVGHLELEVRRDRMTIDRTEGNTTIIYDLEGRNDYSLELDTFNYTIQGLAKYENYTITLSAVNSAGRSKTTLKVVAMVVKKPGISVSIIAGVCVPLVVLLILALLAFGFQRLENNSKYLPKPVYHGNVGNVKPTNIEHEVFDELPSVTKEKQRQLLISLSRESADSQSEDKGYRTSSTSTSGVETDTSSLERGKVENVPLLKMREMRNISGSIDSSPYSLLSELTLSRPHLQMAPDAVETDLDSLSPPGGHYSSTDEGTSVGGSSSYNQLSCFRDTSHPNPYYAMFGQVPVRSSNDLGYVADGSPQCSNVGYDDHLLRADDADDESSQPSTPANPNCAYYSSLSAHTDPACNDRSSGYCDPYVLAAAMPSSPPLRLPSVNLATIEESPNHYVPQAAPRFPNSHDSGYVDNTGMFMGRPSSTQDDASIDSNPSSSQSSPEHAVIIHTNPRRNLDPSGEYMDNTYFAHSPSTPLSNSSLPTSAVIDTPISSPVKNSSRTPQSNGYVDYPPTSNSPSTRPKGNTGYVTCEQLPQVQMSLPLEDARQASEQSLQSPAHVGTVLPTLLRNASAHVPIIQMPMPVPVQSAYIPADTPAQGQASQTDSGYFGIDTTLPRSLPAADVNSVPTDVEQEPLRDDHKQVKPSGYQPQEEIPNTMLERVQESPILSDRNEGLQVSNGSAASQVSPNGHYLVLMEAMSAKT